MPNSNAVKHNVIFMKINVGIAGKMFGWDASTAKGVQIMNEV
jgi:hypothetical protein